MTNVLPFRKSVLTRESLVLLSAWVILAVSVFFLNPDSELIFSWLFMIPFGWILYHTSLRYIYPQTLTVRFPILLYSVWIVAFSVVTFFLIVLLLDSFFENEDFVFNVGGIHLFSMLFVQAPVQWFIFRRMTKANEELFTVRKELGQTEAGMQLLRSQINPHFLFNALNTLYGLALTENAQRTSEAIEKLGSMMRFMLHENTQKTISLTRDLEYLNHYIALQRLRTDSSPGVTIEVTVPEHIDPRLQIPPMLIIPFIENAFKHGISFRDPSEIRVNIMVEDSTLSANLFNTRHVRPEHDPEKHSNGIGLTNVRQRLELMYPGRHELVIHEGTNEYYVHLVLQLQPA